MINGAGGDVEMLAWTNPVVAVVFPRGLVVGVRGSLDAPRSDSEE